MKKEKSLSESLDDFLASRESPGIAALDYGLKSGGGWFIVETVVHALHRNIECVELLSVDNGNGVRSAFRTGDVEIDGGKTIAQPWDRIVRQLKVMCGTVDHGPNKSDKVVLEIFINKKRTARFLIDSNPNPSTDTRIQMVNASYVKPTA